MKLYKVVSKKRIKEYLKNGIPLSMSACKPEDETIPQRKFAVYAYTVETLKQVVKFFGEEDAIIVFETSPEGWFVGDLHFECTAQYKDTCRTLKEVLEEPWLLSKYKEMEVFLPDGHISPRNIVEVKDRSYFIER